MFDNHGRYRSDLQNLSDGRDSRHNDVLIEFGNRDHYYSDHLSWNDDCYRTSDYYDLKYYRYVLCQMCPHRNDHLMNLLHNH